MHWIQLIEKANGLQLDVYTTLALEIIKNKRPGGGSWIIVFISALFLKVMIVSLCELYHIVEHRVGIYKSMATQIRGTWLSPIVLLGLIMVVSHCFSQNSRERHGHDTVYRWDYSNSYRACNIIRVFPFFLYWLFAFGRFPSKWNCIFSLPVRYPL